MDLAIGLAVILVLAWLISRSRRRSSDIVHSHSPQPPQRSPQRPTRVEARWVPPGERALVGDTPINGGLFYIGSALPTQHGYGTDNALIDPSLPLSGLPGNTSGEGVPYYPSYRSLDPKSRRAFVEWLASPRSDPSTYIGYVFIYFYGLERRLFFDKSLDQAATIVGEVERLLSIYGQNNSFRFYASTLLDAAAALGNDWLKAPIIDPRRKSHEVPLRLRAALGSRLQKGKPFTADWALAWYLAAPAYGLRTSAKRCFPEFVVLFRQRFAAAYPEGLLVAAPRRRLSAQYRAASGAFSIELKGEFQGLPDIVALTAPLAKIDRIVADCTAALDPYSRLIARDPAARETVSVQLTLPEELLRNPKAGSQVATLKAHLEALVPRTSAMVRYANLRQLLEISDGSSEKATKAEAVAVATALEHLGFEMEPDPRHGGPTPPVDAEVMLFRPHGQLSAGTASPQFLAARSNIEIAVLVATADGKIDDVEAKTIIAGIKTIAGLSDFERARLIAYLGFLVRNPPDQRVIARFKDRSLKERRIVAEVALTSVAGDGHLHADEIKLLERTYKTLGLPSKELYEGLNGLASPPEHQAQDGPELPTVVPATPVRGIPIPVPQSKPAVETAGSKLDKKKIARIQADTVAVQAILGKVFDDATAHEEPPVQLTPSISQRHPTESATDQEDRFPGLEQRHALLLNEVCNRDIIDQATFAALAQKYGLFPAGAMETINEWAFERFDEPVLDEGEPIEIAHHLIRVHQSTMTSEHPV
jgi:tellurite resistance protein